MKEALLLELLEAWADSLWNLAMARRVLNSIVFTTSSLLRFSGLSDSGHRAANKLQFDAAMLTDSSSGSESSELLESDVSESRTDLLLSFLFLVMAVSARFPSINIYYERVLFIYSLTANKIYIISNFIKFS